jgi:xylulokinase
VSSRIVAGVDSSTQATKVVLVDLDSGAVLARGRAEHRVSGTGGARESDPEQWWTALRDALRQAGPLAGEVAALAVGGQQHGLVTLDAAGRPVRPAVLWNDVRAAGHAERLVRTRGPAWWAGRVGTVPVASITAAKWAWLREREPEHAAAAAAIRLPHDYLTHRLAGAAVTDRGDASGTGWFGTAAGDYDPQVLALPELALDPGLLPRVLPPDAPAGQVGAAVAAELGLPAGALVGPGTGDNMAAALGLGVRPGEAVLSLGTSGVVFAVSDRPAADPTGIVAGFADATGRYLPLACTLNCTLAVDRIATLLGLDRDATEPGGEVVVLPFLDGERTPNLPLAAGLVTGLRHATTAGQVLRAAYEGAAYALLAALAEVHAQASGGLAAGGAAAAGPGGPLVLVGGGARGRTWRETIMRLSGRPVLVPAAGELVALGAAVQAAWCLTGEQPERLAARWGTRAGRTFDPVGVDGPALSRLAAAMQRSRPLLDPAAPPAAPG